VCGQHAKGLTATGPVYNYYAVYVGALCMRKLHKAPDVHFMLLMWDLHPLQLFHYLTEFPRKFCMAFVCLVFSFPNVAVSNHLITDVLKLELA
jgi:hypothetical protein